MGNLKSHEKHTDSKETESYQVDFISNAKPWSLIYSGDLDGCTKSARRHGLDGNQHPLSCENEDCDLYAVCLQNIKVDLNKSKNNINIKRFGGSVTNISYAAHKELRNVIDNKGYEFNGAALAVKDPLALLVCKYSSNFVWHSVFPVIDLENKEIKSLLLAPERNMTILQGEISPDLSRTAIVCYYAADAVSQAFCHELFLYANNDGQILERIPLNCNVDPHVAFDPRCDWSRMVVLGYNINSENKDNDMVVFSLSEKTVLKKSKLSPMKTFGRGHFNILYSKDGNLVIVQKLTNGRYVDTYMFDSDELVLLKYLTTTLPGMLRTCKVSFEPVFSNCGSYMRLLNHVYNENRFERVSQVYQLPRVLNLQFQTRIVIVRNIAHLDDIDKLMLPLKLVKFLKYLPYEI